MTARAGHRRAARRGGPVLRQRRPRAHGGREAAATEGTHAVILDAETVAFIDVTAADMLATLTGELAAMGVQLLVAHDVGQVRDTLRETRFEAIGGPAHVLDGGRGDRGDRAHRPARLPEGLTRPPSALPMISPGPGDAWFAASDRPSPRCRHTPVAKREKGMVKVAAYDDSPKGMGGTIFAASMMLMIGVFQGIPGLVAIFNDEWYVKSANYTFDLDITAYGWIHLILGHHHLPGGPRIVRRAGVGRDGGDLPGHPDRDRELLLHPLLPVLVDPHHRPVRLGDLGAHATGSHTDDLSTQARERATGIGARPGGPRPDRYPTGRRGPDFNHPWKVMQPTRPVRMLASSART